MRATAVIYVLIAWAVRCALTQELEDIPYCSRICFTVGNSEWCSLGKTSNCVCRQSIASYYRGKFKSCIESSCPGDVTFKKAYAAFAAYCVANDWIDAASTALGEATTVTIGPIVIATLATTVTGSGGSTATITSDITATTGESGPFTTGSATTANPSTEPTAETTPTTDESDSNNDSSNALSVGAKAGVGIGAALAVTLVAVILFIWKRKRTAASTEKDEESSVPELDNGDISNRHELDSSTITSGLDKSHSTAFSNHQGMAELDATTALIKGQTKLVEGEVTPPVEQGEVSPEAGSMVSHPTPSLPPATNIAQPMIGDYINSNSSEPSLPSTAELEHLLHEEQLLRERRRTLEQLQRIQEDELALGERIRLLRQRHSGQSAEGGG
uniref:CFEM1 n=1 Tax=Colletotrichum gloeosporioides TaxID=474922 RepID=A0A220QM05_COLGL|nr:CFEM1 [Colletotrichum gloeosporioides]